MPDGRVTVLDPRGAGLRLFQGTVEQLYTGCRWAEGPVWFGDGRFLLWSDIPANRILRWDETNGVVSEYRNPSNHANGHTRDHLGRLLSCEHLTRRITRTEWDGRITVLADRYQGKRLNSPNDIVCQRDGTIWFTDPAFGISGWFEGEPAQPELPESFYRLSPDGELRCMDDSLVAPNGLAFSPDEKLLYVIDSRSMPHRQLLAYDVDGAQIKNRRVLYTADDGGQLDGFRLDTAGNLWCGYGGSEATNGVRVLAPDGTPLLHIQLPERCANLCFGGARKNRLFMASSHSLYALHVNAQGAL
ncbi:SMP-30/gluconolactonase/LRE family protein [Roseateles paludis]|uniref:SMP-30/gluconolactonase/LRE family protein n=1 Tax=Roseateles paludis TaxID=3145238 RepID=A0ABV0G1W5_9BURK